MKQSVDYPVLRRPRLIAGVGAKTAVVIWAIAGLVGLFLGLPWGLVTVAPALIVHTVTIWFFKVDHRIFENYGAYATMPNEYRAGLPCDGEKAPSRPARFARGISL